MNPNLLFYNLLLTLTAVWAFNVRLCYVADWHHKRTGHKIFTADHVSAYYCSHLVWAFASTEQILSLERRNYSTLLTLKDTNPDLKILLSFGGAAVSTIQLMKILDKPAERKKFIDRSITLLRYYGFDGLDLALGGTTSRVAQSTVKDRVTNLIKEIREAFDEDENKRNGSRLLLTLAAPAYKFYIDQIYEPRTISRYLDYINILSYDFNIFRPSLDTTSHHSALYEPSWAGPFGTITNVNYAVTYWIRKGALRHKLLVGVPTYARGFNLTDSKNHGIGAPSRGPSEKQKYTDEEGVLSFYEVCDVLRAGAKEDWSEEQQVPYLYSTNGIWAGYDSPASMRNKVRWLKALGLGGYSVWEVGHDDVNGTCGQGKHPLLKALSDELLYGFDKPLKLPRNLTMMKRGPCVNKQEGIDCDLNDPFTYHQCSDGLVIHSKSCDSQDSNFLFATGLGRCVPVNVFQQEIICEKTLLSGMAPEYEILNGTGLI